MRPLIGDSGAAPAVFSIVFMALMLVALYNINIDELVGERGRLLVQFRRRRIVGWALALVSITGRVAMLFDPHHWLVLWGSVALFLFCCFVAWTELRILLKHREVTSETISLSVSVYLLMGLAWGLLVHFDFSNASPGVRRYPDLEPDFGS